MKARISLALFRIPVALRVSLALVSLVALALGAAAPDDWSHGGGW
jgi:hypothetical protein